jgi:hypothetical protein
LEQLAEAVGTNIASNLSALEHVRRIPRVATALDLFHELGHGVFVAPLPKSSADDVAGWITEAILTNPGRSE